MSSSFGVVEDKLREAEFFLLKLREAKRQRFEADYYFSAFVTATRSVTDAMRASMEGVPGFEEWFAGALQRLKTDPMAPFFVEIRNRVVHQGVNPLNRVTPEHLREYLFRQLGGDRRHVLVVPDASRREHTVLADATSACEQLFSSVVGVVCGCYLRFLTIVDPRWYFTEANFADRGLTLHDALAELGFPSGWAVASPGGPEEWRALRAQQPQCSLNDLFEKYVGKSIPDPDEEQ